MEGVKRLADGAFIPADPDNRDWQQYLLWRDGGTDSLGRVYPGRKLPASGERNVNPATLHQWDDAMSDGCSVPKLLRSLLPWLLPKETSAERAACVLHDRDYYYGGSRRDRVMADEMFRQRLLQAGMARWKANLYWGAVRAGGHPMFRMRGKSWACGGCVFRYTDREAV